MAQVRVKQLKHYSLFCKLHPKQIEGYPDNMKDIIDIILSNKMDLKKFTFAKVYIEYIREEKLKLLLDS